MIHTIDLKFMGKPKSIAAFLLEFDGELALIETGPHSCFDHLKQGVAQLGYKLDAIKQVFLSHIHLDHAGAAWAFAEMGAKVYVHPFGAPHLADPSVLLSSAKRIYQDQMDLLWGKIKAIDEAQIVVAEHGEIFQVGQQEIIAWHTPGHAVHHIAYQVGDALFAGDVAGVRIDNGPVVAPCPPPDINIEDWENSINLILQLPLKEVYLTHFGKVEQLEQHFGALKTILWDWANWMRPHWESQLDQYKVTSLFQQYVAEQLSERGVSEENLIIYENANPSWMSVAGLMRYWKKKLAPKKS